MMIHYMYMSRFAYNAAKKWNQQGFFKCMSIKFQAKLYRAPYWSCAVRFFLIEVDGKSDVWVTANVGPLKLCLNS